MDCRCVFDMLDTLDATKIVNRNGIGSSSLPKLCEILFEKLPRNVPYFIG